METKGPNIHKCLIAVDHNGYGYIIESEPSLFEHDEFDGTCLQDNLNSKEKDIPKEPGIYKCDILMRHISYMTDCGTEYDCDSWIENVVKIELPEIEQEIQARIEFKMNELLTGIKNRVAFKRKYILQSGLASDMVMTQESQYQLQAFEEVAQMIKKETQMGTPSDNMTLNNKRKARDVAVDKIINSLDLRGKGEYHSKINAIVSAIETAQNF